MHENANALTLAPINIKVALSYLRSKLKLSSTIKNLLKTLVLKQSTRNRINHEINSNYFVIWDVGILVDRFDGPEC